MRKASALEHKLQSKPNSADAAGGPLNLVQAIAALIGPVQFVDLSFPRCTSIAIAGGDATQVLLGPRSRLEHDFLARFRQHGGHHPLVVVDWAGDDFSWPPSHLDASLRGVSLVAFFDSATEASGIAERLRQEATALVVPFPHSQTEQDAFQSGGFRGFSPALLKHTGTGTSCVLLVPDTLLPVATDGAAEAGPSSAMPGGITREFTDSNADPSTMTLAARSFIHDGGYTSEGDLHYSWLWTGPDSHFRLVIPGSTSRPHGTLEIFVIRTEERQNIDAMITQIDGRHVPHALDRWSENSGKVVIDLPPSEDYRILTLLVPKMVADGNSGRLLGLCIDKIVLTS
ncbi:hypothetical protein [Bosea sp. PAMC 26642]|uniref:hypothetical protein n=1 Tax=Bosea sp. (strain PAMC 26642) TaxID=1792307 RepID=UPI0007706473|nr:hypothetical protein [Bosea sp. PAMC 26642]AMJ61159.1 hypothetical protein AXW83_13415 [Bosea sp. PAMC 26642]